MQKIIRLPITTVMTMMMLLFKVSHSQTTANSIGPISYEVEKVPASPDIADLGKYGKIPINKYNGTANISIPIHSIELEGLSVPINLTYNTSGIRVNQEASWVGLGWSLSEGFTITREINGFDDLNSSTVQAKSNGWIYAKDYLPAVSPYYFEMSSSDLSSLNNLYTNQNNPDDTEPDVFNVSLPNGSVRFCLPKIVGSQTILTANVMSKGNYKVSFDINNKTFKIVDPFGFVFDFTIKELSTSYGSWEGTQLVDNTLTVTTTTDANALRNIPNWSTNQTKQIIKAWKVSKITSPTGEELSFSYQDGFYMSYPSFSESYDYNINNGNTPQFVSSINSPKVFASTTAFNVKYLTAISGEFGTLNFNLASREDLFSKDAMNRLSSWLGEPFLFNPAITPNTYNAKRLEGVDLIDPVGNSVKSVDFNYGYFNGDKLNHTAKEKFIRLKLNSALIGDKNYSFEYSTPNNQFDLPDKDSKSVDFWGFYNGVANTIRIPTYNRFHYYEPNIFNNYTSYERFVRLNGANRKSDFTFGQYGILNKITYPTGGSTEFEYEGNSITLKRPYYIPTFYSNGDFRTCGLSNSEDYDFRYQYLKLANDPNYSFYDNSFISCVVSSESIINNGQFTVVSGNLCDGKQANSFEINATLSRSGDYLNYPPTGKAVWVKNVQTGVETTIFSYGINWGSSTTVNLNTNITLSPGTYTFHHQVWVQPSPFSMGNASASLTRWYDDSPSGPPADVYEEFQVGGARLYKKINRDHNGTVVTVKEYNYNTSNSNQINSSSGVLMDDLIFASRGSGHFEYTPEQYINKNYTMHSENRVKTNPSAAGSHIGYSDVTEYEIDSNDIEKGRTVTKFSNTPNEYFKRNIGCTYSVIPVPSCSMAGNYYHLMDITGGLDCYDLEYACLGSPYYSNRTWYGDVYVLNAPINTYEHLNGNVQEESIYDINDNLLTQTNYVYEDYSNGYMGITYYPVMTYISTKFPITYPYTKVVTGDLNTNRLSRVLSSSSTQFFDQASLVTTSEFYYEGNSHEELTKTITTSSKGESIIAIAKYPQDLGAMPFMSHLINENRVGQPVVIENYLNRNDGPSSTDIFLSGQTTIYNDQNSDNNYIHPYKVVTKKGNDETERIIYEKYDSDGNLIQYKRPNENSTCLIWGYNNQYPIAKIDNATYTEIASEISNLQNLSNLDDDRCLSSQVCDENYLRSALDSLRNLSVLSEAMITTYTYDPLIGVTSITDPKGYTTYYEYDPFNRLEAVKDADGNILSKNEYNYKQ